MKKINIPTCMNPFEVSVNGVKHSYPAGTEQEVPMGVAMVIEQHGAYHEEKERIAKEGDGSQGGGGGGGYTTCKVHVAFNVVGDGNSAHLIYSTLGDNGNPVSARLGYEPEYDDISGEATYPDQSEYDIEVLCGSHIAVAESNMSGITFNTDLTKYPLLGSYCLFVPAGKTNSSITLSF